MRILFVTSNRIGDAILYSGVLAALLEKYPNARFTIAAGAVSAPIFAGFPNLERLIVFRKKRSRGLHWFHLWRQTVTHFWDIVVDMRRSAIGWIVPRYRLYSVPLPEGPLHRVALAGATIGRALDPPSPTMWTTRQDEEAAAALMRADRPVIIVGPTANWQGKIWPAERYSELIRRIIQPGGIAEDAVIAVTAAPNERDMAQPVLDAIPEDRRIDIIDPPLMHVAACMKLCRAYIGNDSGLMHMAAAAGAPTLGLFGPSKTDLYAPWGAHADFLRTQESFEELIGAAGYNRHTTGSLMGSITVDRAYEKLSDLLKRTES